MASQGAPVVSSAEFVRRFGAWQDRANSDPIFVTHHGRRRHVMLSMPAYESLLAAGQSMKPMDGDRLRLDTLVSQLDGSFVALDATLAVVAINPAACAYFGIAAATVVGRVLGEELPELERSVVRAHLARTLASGEVAAFEMPAVTHPGEWLRCSVFPYGDGVACLLRNITGERSARADNQSLTALEDAIDASGDIGSGRLSLRGTFTSVGSGLAEIAGLAPSALEQVRLTDILPLGWRVEAGRHIDEVLNGGAPRGFASMFLLSDGGERAVRIGLAPLRGDFAVDGLSVVVVAV